MSINDIFGKVARKTSNGLGNPIAFVFAFLLIIGWASFGPKFEWSSSHSLFINTVTTISTFLMVFLIQNTQNRDSKSLHLKLDELIKTNVKSRNTLLNIEECTEEELINLEKEFKRLHKKAKNT